MKLDEMALSRTDAIERCCSLGTQFAEHFDKVYKDGKDALSFRHHCVEMQAWWNSACNIKLKPHNKSLTVEHLVDWFFTAGQGTEDLLHDSDEITYYDMLMLELLQKRSTANIEEVLRATLP